MELHRSLLFVPGNNPRMLEKAGGLDADILVLDLEDSVPMAEKDRARELVRGALADLAAQDHRLYVRINPITIGLAEKDLEAVMVPGLRGINFPKSRGADDVRYVGSLLDRYERERGLPPASVSLLPWIELAIAVLRALEIACASPRVVGIGIGAEDLTADLGIERTKDGIGIAHARGFIPLVARAAHVLAFDMVYGDYQDEAGLVEEALQARRLGYHGKFVIHPNQIEPVNRVFTPTPAEVAWARRVVEAYAAAEAQGLGTTSLEGRMIDRPVAQRARHLLAQAEAITKASQRREKRG